MLIAALNYCLGNVVNAVFCKHPYLLHEKSCSCRLLHTL